MESLTKNRQCHERLQAMVHRCFGAVDLADGGVTELTDGWYNAAYLLKLADGTDTVLKIAPPPRAEVMTYEANLMETEVAMLRLAHTIHGVPVPEVYAFDQSRDLCDADYFFMERLLGHDLSQARQVGNPGLVAALEVETGRILHALNQETGDWFGYPGNPTLRGTTWATAFGKIVGSILADAVSHRVDLGFAPDELWRLIERFGPALAEVIEPRLVHWDSWDKNFFVAHDHIAGLIDFERALWADPLMEACFRSFFVPPTPTQQGYGKTTFTEAEEIRRRLYDLHLGLVMRTECAYRHYDTPSVHEMGGSMINGAVAWLQAH